MLNIWNEDCIEGSLKIPENSIHLGIFDPPFGISESDFDKHYKRKHDNVLDGYQEAPENYAEWTLSWMNQAKRILTEDGSMFVFIGHSSLRYVLNAAHELKLNEINHLIWKYNFGVFTQKKFVTSHYHILYLSKTNKRKFNTNCRFGSQERNENGGSLLYRDLEDVFFINKDFQPNKKKNQNKLPLELINKLILYCSNEGDNICDFFMGNFTTAYSALSLGRKVLGFEINKNSYDYHIEILKNIEFGHELKNLKKVENIVPKNQGKTVSVEEIEGICQDYSNLINNGLKKKDISLFLQEKYKRGKFSIKNILDKNLNI